MKNRIFSFLIQTKKKIEGDGRKKRMDRWTINKAFVLHSPFGLEKNQKLEQSTNRERKMMFRRIIYHVVLVLFIRDGQTTDSTAICTLYAVGAT
jgi:hypothetical protein